MIRMTASRVLFFWAVVLVVGTTFYYGWNLYNPAEKWLYLFGRDARTYAASVLTATADASQQAPVPVPESLAGTPIEVRDGYVLFRPWEIELAFSLQGAPRDDAAHRWQLVELNWYLKDTR